MAAMRVMTTHPNEVWRVNVRDGIVQALVVPHPRWWSAVLHVNGRFKDYADFAVKEDAEAMAQTWRRLVEMVLVVVEDGPTI